MTPQEIINLRLRLDITQTALGQLVGAHQMTIWKWEQGQLSPSPIQSAFLATFEEAFRKDHNVGECIHHNLTTRGTPYTLFKLLQVVFEDES